jgi:hypothetical protein
MTKEIVDFLRECLRSGGRRENFELRSIKDRHAVVFDRRTILLIKERSGGFGAVRRYEDLSLLPYEAQKIVLGLVDKRDYTSEQISRNLPGAYS